MKIHRVDSNLTAFLGCSINHEDRKLLWIQRIILLEKKLVEQFGRSRTLKHRPSSRPVICSTDKQPLAQELEYLWDDSDTTGKSYEIYLARSAETLVKSKITDKYFAPAVVRNYPARFGKRH